MPAFPQHKLLFQAKQRAALVGYVALHELLRLVAGWKDKPDKAAFLALESRYRRLLQEDWENAEAGHYAKRLLFENEGLGRTRRLSSLAVEIGAGLLRSRRNGFRELPRGIELENYPAYFRRNFHWQSGGYLSANSAELYDSLVEFLFLGTASSMRRQAIVPFSEFSKGDPQKRLQVLDVACGTGGFLRQLALSHPRHVYYGLDLSEFYAEHARTRLLPLNNVAVQCANAERLPFADSSLDAVTSIYLFHELPPSIRRSVLLEMKRVLKPGGLLVVQDSAQLSESPELCFFLERFHQRFHEPFFKHYLQDPLEAVLQEVGFTSPKVEQAFVAKTVWAEKPCS
ncbi:MAG: class I SAM-dependent methyltransferase [Polyangiaceae bacterium]|nr:class I SAM-dependent methyltransferase [Polyangiaceae bacterium]